MHTSTVLRPTDFQYWQLRQGHDMQVDFATFCPAYHVWDRVGVVSLQLEDGIRHTGYALLACTTAFYEVLRTQTEEFFDYPHHFAFLDVTEEGVATQGKRLPLELEQFGAPWGALDVWPDSNWIGTPGTVTGMLKKVFDWQITRLFWPHGFLPDATARPLPAHVRRLLATRLQTVYYYQTPQPTVAIHATHTVEEMVQRGIGRLPSMPGTAATALAAVSALAETHGHPYVERYQWVSVEEFLTHMAMGFADAA